MFNASVGVVWAFGAGIWSSNLFAAIMGGQTALALISAIAFGASVAMTTIHMLITAAAYRRAGK